MFNRLKESWRWYRLWGALPVMDWVYAAERFRDSDFRRAIRFYEAGLEKRPMHPAASSARFDLAYCNYRIDELPRALSVLVDALRNPSPLRDTYLLCARIYMIFGRALSAALVLEKALERFPGDVRVMTSLMHAGLLSCMPSKRLVELRRRLLVAKSRLSLEDIRVSQVDTALAHYDVRCGNTERGDRALVRVLASGKAPFEAVLLRGERLLSMGRLLQARGQLERASKASPRDPRPLLLLAKSYQEDSDETRREWAVSLAERACRISHWQNAECISVLADLLENTEGSDNSELYSGFVRSLPSVRELRSFYSLPLVEEDQPLKVSNS